MEEDEKIDIDSAKVVTSSELLDTYGANGHARNGHSEPSSAYEPPSKRTVRAFTAIVAFVILTPFVLTFIGAITGPPRIGNIPSGHLLFLTGDAPSEHTATLRGLFVVDSTGNMRQLAHDTEPQDADAGSRSWINEPQVSPDGKTVAYLQDQIVLQDEIQAISQQLCIQPMVGSSVGQNVQSSVLDLTKLGYKHIIGLAWSKDGQTVNLLNDAKVEQVTPVHIDTTTQSSNPPPSDISLTGLPELATDKYLSSLSYPKVTASGALYLIAKSTRGAELLGSLDPVSLDPSHPSPVTKWPLAVPDVHGYGLNADATEAALVPSAKSHDISIIDTATGKTRQVVHAKWGWSIFGGREITSVGFSPDGRYLLYTVSKPPVPEEEMFILNLSTGAVNLLPYRSGRASWTWVL